ncbi:MAG: hypothetical protein CUN55_14230, partial [Phototrophicales bacterium]
MAYPTCPHCGANRDNMADSQRCWRCGRLPAPAVQAMPISPPPPRPQPSPPSLSVTEEEPPYIPTWLAISGTLGILLFLGVMFGIAYLFLTAEESLPSESDTLSALDSAPNIINFPTALPTNTLDTNSSFSTPALPPTTSIQNN